MTHSPPPQEDVFKSRFDIVNPFTRSAEYRASRLKAIYDILADLHRTKSLPHITGPDDPNLKKCEKLTSYAEWLLSNDDYWKDIPITIGDVPTNKIIKDLTKQVIKVLTRDDL